MLIFRMFSNEPKKLYIVLFYGLIFLLVGCPISVNQDDDGMRFDDLFGKIIDENLHPDSGVYVINISYKSEGGYTDSAGEFHLKMAFPYSIKVEDKNVGCSNEIKGVKQKNVLPFCLSIASELDTVIVGIINSWNEETDLRNSINNRYHMKIDTLLLFSDVIIGNPGERRILKDFKWTR